MGGFWERVEAWLQALVADPPRMARYFNVAWWISTAFIAIGVAVIFAVHLGVWSP